MQKCHIQNIPFYSFIQKNIQKNMFPIQKNMFPIQKNMFPIQKNIKRIQ